MDTPYRNLAVDRVLACSAPPTSRLRWRTSLEYDTPEQEREKNPESWFFLSFANDEQFLGGAFVGAHGPHTAIQRAREIDIAFADATVECTPSADDEIAEHVPGAMRDRLLTEEEVRELGGE